MRLPQRPQATPFHRFGKKLRVRARFWTFAAINLSQRTPCGVQGNSWEVGEVDCSHYLEQFFPESARQSVLSRIPLDITLGLDIRGPGGGRWSFRRSSGELMQVRRDLDPSAQVVYRMDTATFEAIVQCRQTPQEAFFAQRIEIEGDIEKALTLATLFEDFTRKFPYGPHLRQGDVHATHLSG